LHERVLKFHDDRFKQDVYAYRTPGYPWFLAACGGSLRAARLAQALVDTSTALAAYLLARKLLDDRAAAFAAALVALNPFMIYFSGLILSETLFTAMLAWGIYFACKPKRRWASAIVLVGAVLVRPSALLLPILIPAAATVVVNWRNGGPYHWRAVATVAVQGAFLLALTLGLWGVRNYRVLNAWIWTTTNGGITQYDGFNPNASGASDQRFLEGMPELKQMGEVERSRKLSAMASEYVWSHPGRSVFLMFRKIARTWSPMPLSEQFGSALYVVIGLAWGAPFYALVLAGIFRGNLSSAIKALLLLPAVYFTVVHALSVGSLRYRVPLEPQLAIVAASAVGKRLQSGSRESR
jgi:4-amino-4-deoxy-L-arabinose transferase-like glycosyltransferase